jgi:hypothetical protein|tara:strand:- start:1105 stop:1365 length:261 start_codon:yes stop_codon:yes gene_type:complete
MNKGSDFVSLPLDHIFILKRFKPNTSSYSEPLYLNFCATEFPLLETTLLNPRIRKPRCRRIVSCGFKRYCMEKNDYPTNSFFQAPV